MAVLFSPNQAKTGWSFAAVLAVLLCQTAVSAFQSPAVLTMSRIMYSSPTPTPLFMSAEEASSDDIESYLKEHYPAFMTVLSRNEKACKILRESGSGGFTVFAPNDQAMIALGESKVASLGDPRNAETVEKIGAYHVIGEPVRADALFNAGGVVTLGGDVLIDRSVSGGFFGVGGKEDGGVTVNGAKVLSSTDVGSGVVHEMDGFISPNLLWRYLDQLRIPGSN